jgi:hypothetical protein
MRKLTATLCLTFAILLGSVGMSASADIETVTSKMQETKLPACPLQKDAIYWSKCWGSWSDVGGQ